MPVGLVGAPQRISTTSPRVAILGAGFAGLSRPARLCRDASSKRARS
jgi:monoamine oxidase